MIPAKPGEINTASPSSCMGFLLVLPIGQIYWEPKGKGAS